MNIPSFKNPLLIVFTLITMVFISSCEKEQEQKTASPIVESKHYNNHGVAFEYPSVWKIYSDKETGFGDITVILATNDETNIVVKLFPKEKSGNLEELVKTYDAQYYLPVFTEPVPVYEWSEITRSQHKGVRKVNDTPNPTVKRFIKEYFRFQLGEQTALVVMESNRNEFKKYGDEIVVILNTIKVTG